MRSRVRDLFRRRDNAGPSNPSGRSGYLPGLDGLRALSVIAVLIFHARPEWLPGGFIGVEVFFVISGFIITRALLGEWREHGRIGLVAFWMRRARRLLPAVGLLLVAVMTYVALFQPDEAAALRGDVLAALAYVTNWHLILGDQSYFDSFQRPSMLRHLWSLAVEEQFYLIWPLLLGFGLPLLRHRGFFVAIVGGIAASAIGMALLYDPSGDNSRVYYGTDTRAAGLLVGAALAFVAGQRQDAFGANRLLTQGVAVLGVAALAALVGFSFWLTDARSFLYQGGFLTVSLVSAVAIFGAIQTNVFSRMLSLRPLRWVGVRSYGIYLWHWPIYMLVWPDPSSTLEWALQLAAVVAISAASYALVEKPVREGALARTWEHLRSWSQQSLRYRSAAVFAGTSTAVLIASLVAIAATAKAPETPPYFQTGSIKLQSAIVVQDVGSVVRAPTLMGRVQTTLAAISAEPSSCPSDNLSPGGVLLGVASSPFGSTCPRPVVLFQQPAAAANASASIIVLAPEPTDVELAADFAAIEPTRPAYEPSTAQATVDPTPTQEPAVPAQKPQVVVEDAGSTAPVTQPSVPSPAAPAAPASTHPRVTAIGDSVMLGAAYSLAASIPGLDLDAAVGRQASAAIALLQDKASAGILGDIVIVQIGNNGTFTSDQFDQMMSIIGPDRTVIVLTLHVPRSWEASNNAVILDGISRYPNTVLVDWATAASTYPEVLYNDGIHLNPQGASYYAQLVVAALGG